MLKIKKTLVLFASLFLIVVLAACNKGIKGISVEMNVRARRDLITVSASFIDNEKRIFDSITPSVSVYKIDKDGKEGDRVGYQQLSILDGTKVSENTKSQPVEFKDLAEETEYIVKLSITEDGYQHDLETETVKTVSEGTIENPILISTKEDFKEIQYDRAGHFKLTADIDFEGGNLDPFFVSKTQPFTGSIDGDNHTIKNYIMRQKNNSSNIGLIAYNEGIIKNLVIENAKVEVNKTSDIYAGIIAGTSAGIVEGNTIKNSSIVVTSSTFSLKNDFVVGGLIGSAVGGAKEQDDEQIYYTVKNNTLDNVNIEVNAVLRANVGGLVGEVKGTDLGPSGRLTLDGNSVLNSTMKFNAKIKTTVSKNDNAYYRVGGLIGYTENAQIINSIADIDIEAKLEKAESALFKDGLEEYTLDLGGIIGLIENNVTFVTIKNVIYDGSVKVDGQYVYTINFGGLIGNGKSTAGKYAIISNAVVNLTSLDMVINKDGENKPVEEKENEEDKKPTYSLTYGASVGKFTVEGDLIKFLEDNNIYSMKELVATISESNTITPNKTTSKIGSKEDITKEKGFTDIIINYVKNLK